MRINKTSLCRIKTTLKRMNQFLIVRKEVSALKIKEKITDINSNQIIHYKIKTHIREKETNYAYF